MLNSIQVNEATVREIRKINGVLILSLLSTQSNGRNSYFQAKCYGQSSSLNIMAGARLSLDGKIAFDNNGKAYVAINFPSQIKIAIPQSNLKTTQSKGIVMLEDPVAQNSVKQFSSQRNKSRVIEKGEIVVEKPAKFKTPFADTYYSLPLPHSPEITEAFAKLKAEKALSSPTTNPEAVTIQQQDDTDTFYHKDYKGWEDDYYGNEEYPEDHSQYDNDTVPSDWDEICF